MSKRVWAFICSVAVLTGMLCICPMGVSAAEWTDGIEGQYTVVDTLPGGDNRLAGITPTKDSTLTAWSPSYGAVSTLTDGEFCTDEYTRVLFDSCWGPQFYGFTFALDAVYALDSFLVGSENGDGQQQYWLKIYVGNDFTDLYTDANLVAECKGMTKNEKNLLIRPDGGQAVNGCYVGIATYSSPDNIPDNDGQSYLWYGNIRLGEWGAYGAYVGEKPKAAVHEPLIAGKKPADTYLAWAGDASAKMIGQNIMPKNLEYLTDGNENTLFNMNTWSGTTYVKPTLHFENPGDGNLLDPMSPWIVFIYYLGGKSRIDSISLLSTSEKDYYTAGAEYYVGNSVAELFDEQNRVLDTGGYHMTVDPQTERRDLDPEYDWKEQAISCDLTAAPITGRYVAIAVTRPYPVGCYGWAQCRIAELSVIGELLEADAPFDETNLAVTNTKTGISVRLTQLDMDDKAFFDGLQLDVAVSEIPAGVSKSVQNNWILADSSVYTLRILDKNGTPVPEDVIGERCWQISIPTDGAHFQMMGRLADGEISRLRHSYTNADNTAVVAGTDYGNEATLTGNGISVVLLRYNELSEIHKAIGFTENVQLKVNTVNGAAAQNTAGGVWLIAALAVGLLLVGVLLLLLAKKADKAERGTTK